MTCLVSTINSKPHPRKAAPTKCHPERAQRVEGPAFVFIVAFAFAFAFVVAFAFAFAFVVAFASASASAFAFVVAFASAFAFVVAFASAFAFVVAFASEIGPGFSPDINRPKRKRGFSPWGMVSFPNHHTIHEAAA